MVRVKTLRMWLRRSFRVTSVRVNQGIPKSHFQIRESQGKSTFLEKTREISGNFVMIFICLILGFIWKISNALSVLTCYKYFFDILACAVGARILINNIAIVCYKVSSWIRGKKQGNKSDIFKLSGDWSACWL